MNVDTTTVSLASTSEFSGLFENIISLTSDNTNFRGTTFIATENATTVLSAGIDTDITLSSVTSGIDDSKSTSFYVANFLQDDKGIST